MDTGRHKSTFFAALDHDADGREAFLASACDGDVDLRAKVEALLDAHDDAGTFMAAPTADLESEALAHPTPPAPEWVGPYRVIELLGEGGFGTVYLAEQEVPVRRRVAVCAERNAVGTRYTSALVARFAALVGPEHDFLRRYRAFLAYFLIRTDRIEEGAAIIAALDELANPPAGIYDQTVLAFARGVVLGATGRTDEARLALEEALRLDAETDEGPVFLRTAIARALSELDA